MSDIQNWSTDAESGYQTTTAAPNGFPENSLPSVVNNVVREVMAAVKRRLWDANGSVVSTGSANAYAATANETVAALYDGLRVCWEANHSNTGAATLAWDGLAAKAIKKDFNVDLYAGDIPAGYKVECIFDADNDWWQATNLRSNAGNTQIDPFSGDGVKTAFVLSADPVTKKNVQVFIAGVYQQNSTYSISGTTLTFTEAPPNLTNIEVRLISPTPAAVVDDDTIGTDQLAPGTAGGVIAFNGSGDPVDIGAGTADYVLTSNGASAAPSWKLTVPTGAAFPYVGASAPMGYVLASGKTIGSGASAATERANDDTEALFTILWDGWSDNEAPVTGGRGASAAADWAADKVIAVPDLRGATPVGLDNIGGSAAGRITNASTNGANAVVMGGRIGDETHTLTVNEIPSHVHDMGRQNVSGGTDVGRVTGSGTDVSTSSAGGDQPHSNTQPGVCMNMIIKL